MITSRQKIEFYDAIMDVTTVEMRGVFEEKELDFLADLLKKLTLDMLTIELWPQIIARVIEKKVAANIDAKSLTKKVKSLTVAQSVWLLDTLKERAKAA